MSHVHLCNVENDKVRPSLDLVLRAAAHYGLDPYVLHAVSVGINTEEYLNASAEASVTDQPEPLLG